MSPLLFIAQAHAVAGNKDEAIATAREAVNQYPSHISLSACANLLAVNNEIEEAAKMIDRVRELVPRFTLRGSINAYRRAFGTEQAREAVTSGLQILMDLGHE